MSLEQPLARILIAAAIAVILAGIAFEVRAFKAGRRRVTRGQMRLRVVSAALLVVILAMALASAKVLPGGADGFAKLPRHEKAVVLSYWSLCVGLSLLVVVLALADLRLCIRTYSSQRDEILVGPRRGRELRN